jgi:hypothetical protein
VNKAFIYNGFATIGKRGKNEQKARFRISSQVPLTTQPPFQKFVEESFAWNEMGGKSIRQPWLAGGASRHYHRNAGLMRQDVIKCSLLPDRGTGGAGDCVVSFI